MKVDERLKDIYVLDGGLASELERNGCSLQNNPLWSASLLHKYPDAILRVHKSYLENGADIILTASYQASIDGFQKHLKLSRQEGENLIKLSVELAKRAKADFKNVSKGGKEILIAGSVGSYGAYLADGSEYNGKYCDNITEEELIEWHRPRIKCLVDAGVDLLAFETIPASMEAIALIKLLNELPNTKAWLSFSCQSDHETAYKEDIANVCLSCAKLSSPEKLIAMGVNCCSSEIATSILKDINEALPHYPLVVYPNSGETWDTKLGWKGEKKFDDSYLEEWTKLNAKIIGGCCRTTPENILSIYNFFQNRKPSSKNV